MDFPYIFRWDRQGRKDHRCKVTARGTKNSIRVEFADGYAMVTSGNAIRKVKPADLCEAERALSDAIERDPTFPLHGGLI